MKILISHFGRYKKDGWGRTFSLGEGLAALGHDVTLLCSSNEKKKLYDRLPINGVKVIVFYDFIPQKLLSSGYGCISFICRMLFSIFHKFEIVHSDSHRPSSYYPCIINKKLYGSLYFIEWWDNFEAQSKNAKTRKWYKQFLIRRDAKAEISTKIVADGCIVMSKILLRKGTEIGMPLHKLKIIHGGSNIKQLRLLPLGYCKEKLGLKHKTLTFGYIGSGDADYSDLDVLFDAILSLIPNYDIKFLNYGRPFKKCVDSIPALKNVIIECGWVDYYQDPSLLAATDIFVLTKLDNVVNNSGWPSKFGDYLACGRPVILNLYGELIDFCRVYNPGVIEVAFEVPDIVKKIKDICSGKYDLLQMGNTNRIIAEQHSWLQKSRELEQFYLDIKSNSFPG